MNDAKVGWENWVSGPSVLLSVVAVCTRAAEVSCVERPEVSLSVRIVLLAVSP